MLADQDNFPEALKSYRKSLAIANRIAKSDPGNADRESNLQSVVARIGGLSYNFVLARDFAKALEAADLAIKLKPEMIWVHSNRAHALMLLGRTDQARALSLKYRDQKNVQDDKPWTTVILDDFADLRKKGLTDPLMTKIEKQFAGRV